MIEAEERLDHMRALLDRHGRVHVSDLATHFHVSKETVRRDLKQLELAGEARCVYGGAVKPTRDGDEPIADRMRVNGREKARIGAEAAKLLRRDIKIFVDAGTTTLAFARHLKDWPDIAVYTNSLDIVELLCGFGARNVTAVGGQVSPRYRAFMGSDPLLFVANHLFDIAFVSIVAVDYELGFMDLGADEAHLRRQLRKHSRQCVMLADSSKFGRQGSIRTYDLADVDVLVTDAPVRPDFAAKLDKANVKVHYA
ncbi:DeoR/GlpR family DNA-binding transcription regulator [Mesorhizobium sp. J428]|uniref:DeoR/GlpR family DNA-binding transcription regulator n=1 Tax=Mesorhizobium sp. J428 TaxID=2898440 RepID=UPI002151D389|nr:DeoR/GlpR family DNA-binding transcription regulator [Mesorhizobium sp. J428]MCR5859395.1 DeoR/GlpR family DNA-binding transcription regulator [Mesorhizobium sp. J428]